MSPSTACACLWLLCTALLAILPPPARADEPLRLATGEPLVCVYYFTHWWEPWKSSDDAIRADLRRLRAMGVNTLLLDHEWSQAIDGDWRLIDRANRLAKEGGMAVVPWLSPKTWSDVSPGDRQRLAKKWYGVDIQYGIHQDGSPAAPLIYDPSVLTMGAQYTLQYLDRYLANGPLLRLKWKGETRPVISLSVETAWDGSFDDRTNERFRAWLKRKYGTIARVNAAWGASLPSFAAVDPRDAALFDYAGRIAGGAAHRQAVEDHIAFRAQTIRECLAQIGKAVRRKRPNVLLLAEAPYQYDAEHPDAKSYRIQYAANPESCDWADIVLLRCTGPLTALEIAALRRHQKRTGQRFILTYRTYSDWDLPAGSDAFAKSVELYPRQAAEVGSGFGFYSYNEMVDTHVAYSPNAGLPQTPPWTRERSERAIGLMEAMVKRYLEVVR